MEINNVKEGEFLSEISHYKVRKDSDLELMSSVSITHLASSGEYSFTGTYVKDHLKSASQYDEVIKVGKEDKFWTNKQVADWIRENWDGVNIHDFAVNVPKVGDLKLKGIRSVFQEIRDQTVFTVVFQKVDQKKTKKAYEAEISERVERFLVPVIKAKTSKKSMEEAAKASVTDLIKNPVLDYIPGEMRTMICYKTQFSSRDGHYSVFDLEKQGVAQVNIKTIQSIIFDGVKYELDEK
jgi:hypothetical protein